MRSLSAGPLMSNERKRQLARKRVRVSSMMSMEEESAGGKASERRRGLDRFESGMGMQRRGRRR